jgi:hypothetical protein
MAMWKSHYKISIIFTWVTLVNNFHARINDEWLIFGKDTINGAEIKFTYI